MAKNQNIPSQPEGTSEKSKLEKKSATNRKIMKILNAVRAGTMAVTIAAQSLSNMGCGARTGLDSDEMALVDDDHGGDAGVGTGEPCMGVDAGEPCMGVDAGEPCMGVDAGEPCMGMDAGEPCMGMDAGEPCMGGQGQ